VVYKNGRVTHYPNGAAVNDPSAGGTTFTSVYWKATKGGTLELRSVDTVIANAKLSTRCPSTIADWLQGNIWHSSSNNNKNDDERRSPNKSSNNNAKAVASRTDATGTVIKVETAAA